VATVKEVIHDSGQPFAIVRAVPTAALNRSRYLLLVFSDNRTPEERANDAAQAQEAEDKKNGTAPVIPSTVPKPAQATTPPPAATPAVVAPAATPVKPAAHPAKPAATKPPASTPATTTPAAKPPAAAPAARPATTAPATTRQREE
jgi:rod shape-determining protein MreC